MYFDNAATTMVSESVADTVMHYMREEYANASSIYSIASVVKKDVEKARKTIAEYINTSAENIIFTSGGSESNSLAITGLRNLLISKNKKHVITSSIEHPSVIESVKSLEKDGFIIKYLKPDQNGIISTKQLEEEIISDTEVGLVSIMAVNNEIGTIQDISKIGRICKEHNVIFHTDCVQAIGTIDIDVEEMSIDLLSLSGHKFHAPKGVGALYFRNQFFLSPIILGGDQEFNLRAGTENVPAIIGLAQAIKDVYKIPVLHSNIKTEFIRYIKELFKKKGIDAYFNGDSETNTSKIVNIRFPGIDGQTLVLMLSAHEIYISAGSACKAHYNKPSHVLTALGLSEEEALSSVRISFSRYNTIEEVKKCAEAICDCVNYLKEGGI